MVYRGCGIEWQGVVQSGRVCYRMVGCSIELECDIKIVSAWGCLPRGAVCMGGQTARPRDVHGRYTSYWNADFLIKMMYINK